MPQQGYMPVTTPDGKVRYIAGPREPTEQEIQSLIRGIQIEGFSIGDEPPVPPAAPQASATERFGAGLATGFAQNQPVQDPRRMISEVGEAVGFLGLPGFVGELGKQQAATYQRGSPMGPEQSLSDPFSSLIRGLNVPLSMVPLLGPGVSGQVVEPAAQAVTLGEEPNRAGLFGQAVGGAGGLGLSLVGDKYLGRAFRGARQAGKEAIAARQTGTPLSAAQRPGAGGGIKMVESFLSRTPGGKTVIDAFRLEQMQAFVTREVSGFMQQLGSFRGPKQALGYQVKRSVDGVIDDLTMQTSRLYDEFELELKSRQPMGAEVGPTGRVGALQPTPITADVSPAASIADELFQQYNAQRAIIGPDPDLDALANRAQHIAGLAGQQVDVQTLIKSRSTLLKLARRLDNPLGSEQARLVGKIFDPIDHEIEMALRRAGGTDLSDAWRQAANASRRSHEIIDETIFEALADMEDVAAFAPLVEKAPAVQLKWLKNKLPRERWDQVRAEIVRERVQRAISGESLHGGGHQGAELMQIELSPKRPVSTSYERLTEAIAGIEETRRAVLFSRREIDAFDNLLQTASRIADTPEEAARLVASGISAGLLIGVGAGAFGLMTGGPAGAAIGGLAGFPAFKVATEWGAKLMVHPEYLDKLSSWISGAGAGAVTASILTQEMLNSFSDQELMELVADLGIPPGMLKPEVAARLTGVSAVPPGLQGLIQGPQLPPGIQR